MPSLKNVRIRSKACADPGIFVGGGGGGVAEILRLIEIFICIFNFLIISADINIFIYAFMI